MATVEAKLTTRKRIYWRNFLKHAISALNEAYYGVDGLQRHINRNEAMLTLMACKDAIGTTREPNFYRVDEYRHNLRRAAEELEREEQ